MQSDLPALIRKRSVFSGIRAQLMERHSYRNSLFGWQQDSWTRKQDAPVISAFGIQNEFGNAFQRSAVPIRPS